jgi:hypothetical protein
MTIFMKDLQAKAMELTLSEAIVLTESTLSDLVGISSLNEGVFESIGKFVTSVWDAIVGALRKAYHGVARMFGQGTTSVPADVVKAVNETLEVCNACMNKMHSVAGTIGNQEMSSDEIFDYFNSDRLREVGLRMMDLERALTGKGITDWRSMHDSEFKQMVDRFETLSARADDLRERFMGEASRADDEATRYQHYKDSNTSATTMKMVEQLRNKRGVLQITSRFAQQIAACAGEALSLLTKSASTSGVPKK